MGALYENLLKYSRSDNYPFHMPGHKRKPGLMDAVYDIDITEIDGFDDLHEPTGMIRELMREAESLYNSKRTYLLVNGSTCGILAGMCAALAGRGDEKPQILMARNSHKSAYHWVELSGAEVGYIYPELTEDGLCKGITIEDIDFDKVKDGTFVYITSPTYEGYVSDIREISAEVHKCGGILMVDEAHGAHLVLSSEYPDSSVLAGADIVVMSLHKTLPAMTQTALLHLTGDRVDEGEIERYLDIFETSSPSYVLMASIDNCLSFVRQKGREYTDRLIFNLKRFYDETKNLSHIRVLRADEYRDISKIVIFGEGVYERLRDEYHLQLEMRTDTYSLAMTSLMDDDEGFDRLIRALKEIDVEYKGEIKKKTDFGQLLIYKPKINKTISEAVKERKEWVSLSDACGLVSASYIYYYPPGIPFVVPGEEFDEYIISCIKEMRAKGFTPVGGGYFDRGEGEVLICRSTV